MNTAEDDRARAAGALATAKLLASLFCVLALACCSERGQVEVIREPVFGFYLGEEKEGLFERVRYVTSWKEVKGDRTVDRGELYEFSRAPDGSREVERLRLAFVDGRLMEVVAYMRMTNVSMLLSLRDRYCEKYGLEATSPDGTEEMAYKTYRIKPPGMSVTIRRITKKPRDELYVQFMHDGLHRRIVR